MLTVDRSYDHSLQQRAAVKMICRSLITAFEKEIDKAGKAWNETNRDAILRTECFSSNISRASSHLRLKDLGAYCERVSREGVRNPSDVN